LKNSAFFLAKSGSTCKETSYFKQIFRALSLFKNTMPVPCTDTYCQKKKKYLRLIWQHYMIKDY